MQNFDDYQTFEAKVTIHRIEDRGDFVAEVAIRCIETGDVFEIADGSVRMGASTTKLATNFGGTVLSIPIRPPTRPLPGNWDKEREWNESCAPPGLS